MKCKFCNQTPDIKIYSDRVFCQTCKVKYYLDDCEWLMAVCCPIGNMGYGLVANVDGTVYLMYGSDIKLFTFKVKQFIPELYKEEITPENVKEIVENILLFQ